MAANEPTTARTPRIESGASDREHGGWHHEDDAAARARARRLLKSCGGSWLTHLGEGMGAIGHAVASARRLRAAVAILATLLVLFGSGFAVLWWRLGTGPINLDLLTPWLVSAIEDNLGNEHTVEVGGTQIERAGHIRIAVRIRDIVVRDRAHAIVATAPKAEVRISTLALLMGRLRAQSLNLVGAELSVRITPDGAVIVSTGESARPLATGVTTAGGTPGAPPPAEAGQTAPQPQTTPPDATVSPQQDAAGASRSSGGRSGMEGVLAGLDWLDGLSRTGLDGENLDEIGLKNGNLIVDDQRNGSRLKFQNISLSLRRPSGGGIAVSLAEEGKNAWSLKAVVGPASDGVRALELSADNAPVRNIILALRLKDLHYTADLPLSGSVRGEIGRDGLPTFMTGKVSLGAGQVIDLDTPDYPMDIDAAELSIDWDAGRRVMVAPFQVVSGANRVTLLANMEPPNDAVPNWQLTLSGGTILFGPQKPGDEPLIFNRIAVRFRFDTDNRRVLLTQADFSNGEISIAGSGTVDYTGEPRLMLGLAGTPMPASALKRIWPIIIVPEVREWIIERVDKGTLQRMEIAVNSPVRNLSRSGPPIPDDGLAINFVASNVAMHPVDEIPGFHDADLKARVTGRTATINIGQGLVDTPAGRRLTISDLVFEIPDFVPKPPPARVRFRIDGPVPAAAEILASDRLREFSGVPIDPNGSKGTVSAQVLLGLPIKNQLSKADTTYSINVDIAGFAADKLVMNQKLEANALKIVANNQGYQVRGDVKIAGQPASVDYRKSTDGGDADVKLQATLDDASRARLGVDLGPAVSGNIPVKVNGKIGASDHDNKLGIEADLTAARIDNMLPGWVKAPGKAGRVVFNAVQKPQSTRLEDIVIDGGGAQIKGSLELDPNGDVLNANFPVYSPSEGDKATLKAERGTDGSLKVSMRGDVFDARNFIKSALSGKDADKSKTKAFDFDLDLKMGAVAGNLGEALRGVDLKLSRRAGVIKAFQLAGKVGRDAPLTGDIRGRNQGREVVYLETGDAGALFRFADIYSNMYGGKMWVAMDPPASDGSAQDGLLNIRDFSVKGEAALDRVVANDQQAGGKGVSFTHMRAEFTRQTGQLSIKDGIVHGPTVGATIEGSINYPANQVRMSGTFVPMYALNNMFGQIPIVGLVLGGGSNEGLIGITYEVVGTPGKPVLRVNPISAIAPGLLRKIFDFGTGRQATPNDNYPAPNN